MRKGASLVVCERINLIRRIREREANDVVGILIESRFAPAQKLYVSIGVNIVRDLGMAVVSDPALVSIVAIAPSHESRLPAPCIVVVLVDAAVFGIVCRVQGLRV